MSDKNREHEIEDSEELEEFTVVELESEDGEIEEFVIIDQVDVDEATYCLMASLESVEDMEEMTEEEYREVYGEAGGVFLMRSEGTDYMEPSEEEYERIKLIMDEKMAANLQRADESE